MLTPRTGLRLNSNNDCVCLYVTRSFVPYSMHVIYQYVYIMWFITPLPMLIVHAALLNGLHIPTHSAHATMHFNNIHPSFAATVWWNNDWISHPLHHMPHNRFTIQQNSLVNCIHQCYKMFQNTSTKTMQEQDIIWLNRSYTQTATKRTS